MTDSALGAKTEMDRDNRSELRDLDDPRMNIDMSVLEEHLSASVESIAEEAKNTPSEVLESVNSVLKPYLKQLSTLKAQLTIQLKELRDSRAYLCLGVTADASDATIKKAYHMLAIKLHPDKPGGDTAKFQQLQDYYQDIMKTRKAAKTERDAVNKMRGRASTHQEPFEESDLSSAFNCENKTETSEEPQEQAEKVESQDDLVEKEVESSETTKDEAEVVEPEHSSKAVEGTIKIKPSISPKASVENLEENVNSSVGQDDRKKTTKLEEGEFQFDKEDGPSLADDRKEEYESDSAHAAAIASKIDLLLGKIKEAATDCTNLAQLNIKWQKKIEKATSYQFPQGLRELKKLINCKTSNKSFDEKASDASFTFNAESCSLQKAVSPIEACCELSQKVSSLAMELSSQCGVRFAMTASTNKTFLQAVEKSMMFSLGALKTVVTLIHAHEQLMSCLRSVQDSMPVAAENEEVYDLVCEMVRAGVKSNVVTISNAVDRVVETALTTSTVCDCIHAIIRQTEAQILADAKKKAELEAQEEQEQDYCEEDREALRKCREERQQEFFRQSAQEKNESNGSQKKTDQNNMEDFFGEGIKSLDDLRDKIKTLQLQLKLQHVQALQTMNKETIQLQQQILQELKGLPFVTSVESLFSDNRSKPKADGESSGFKFSLLSLIAEFVDSSCNSIRAGFADMVAAKFEDESCLWMELGEYVDGRAKLTVQDIKLVENHLNWLAIVLSDSSNLMDGFYEKIWNHVNANRYPCDILSQEEEEFAYTANVRKSKLALLPDFRSKTLYLASMIDGESLQCIVKEELFDRMLEIVQEHTNKIFSKREDKMAKLLLEISSDSATKTNEDILDCDDDNRISSIYGSYPSFRTSVFRDSLSDDSQESVNQKLDYPRTFLHEDPDFISYLDSAYADMIYGSEDQQRHEDDAADNLRASSVHDYLDEESEDEDDLGLLYPKSYKNLYSKYFPDEDLVHANYESSVGFDGLKTSAEKSYLSRNYRRNENYNDINQHVNDDNHFF